MKKLTHYVLIVLLSLLAIDVSSKEVKVAAVEFAAKSPGGFDENMGAILNALDEAARNGAKLMVLPEAALNGFFYQDAKALMPYTDTVPGKATAAIQRLTKKYNAYVVLGLYERDPVGGRIFNAAVLIGPEGVVGKYHKNNLAPGEGNIASPGKLGFPVFDTEIGKIGLVICFDDTSLQNLLLPALRGADFIAQPIGSFKFPAYLASSYTNHSTMANMSTAVVWMGTNVISTNSSGVEGPGAGFFTFDGSSSIWNNRGKRLISAPLSSWTQHRPPQTVYATIDTDSQSPQKAYWLNHRRPDLYRDLNGYRYPDDSAANKTPKQVSAMLVQYEPKVGDVALNFQKVDALIRNHSGVFNLVVLPFNSLLGSVPLDKTSIATYAEAIGGRSYQLASGLANKYKTYLLFSMPEKKDEKFYQTAILFDPDGKQAGIYRKSHLNDAEKLWATAGDELPVFSTRDFGNIAIMLDDEVRIPELTQLYGIYRADLILVPAMYNGKEYGSAVDIPPGVVSAASNRGMAMWYNIAKYAQAYTLVANYIRGEHADIGQSAVYSLTPEAEYYPPNIAPDKEVAHVVNFTTHLNNTVFIDQDRLIASRRWDQALPLTLDVNGACFKDWQKNSTNRDGCTGLEK